MPFANYPDSKCSFGYMTLCDDCKAHAPKHVDTTAPITEAFPIVACELCKRPARYWAIRNRYERQFWFEMPLSSTEIKWSKMYITAFLTKESAQKEFDWLVATYTEERFELVSFEVP